MRPLFRGREIQAEDWDGSEPVTAPLVLLVDGYLSQSKPRKSPPFNPWIEMLGPVLRDAGCAANMSAMSYSAPGKHYGPVHTQRSPADAADLLQRYLGAGDRHVVGFSFGGTLSALGTARLAAVALKRCVTKLILVQPAFALSEDYLLELEALAARRQPMASPFAQLFHDDGTFVREIVAATQSLIVSGVEVWIALWSGDRFLAYPSGLVEELAAAGVKSISLEQPGQRLRGARVRRSRRRTRLVFSTAR
ncbi:MAG: hypothetical protein AB7J35_18295 [Dehalococcoidia bacterium]